MWRRKPAAGLVHHYDCGTQHTALSLGKRLEGVGALSLRWEGRAPPRSLDNATISEGFLSRLNAGFSSIIGAFPSGDREECRLLRVPLEAFGNRRRLRYSLGYVSPESCEDLMTKEEVAVA